MSVKILRTVFFPNSHNNKEILAFRSESTTLDMCVQLTSLLEGSTCIASACVFMHCPLGVDKHNINCSLSRVVDSERKGRIFLYHYVNLE